MSNNKTIKLYTEEEVKKAIKDAFLWGVERHKNYALIQKAILIDLTPIELPSDEEIKKESLKTDFEYTFRNGVMWMRNKIGGGNK